MCMYSRILKKKKRFFFCEMATLKRSDPSARLTKLKCLGEGSYGAVFKMKDELTGDNVAVKVVPVEKDLEDLMNEIKILKQCKSPYITQYITSYLNGGDEIWVFSLFFSFSLSSSLGSTTT